MTLSNKAPLDCSTVNCGNVCRMTCDRDSTPEGCVTPCGKIKSNGRAYVFKRPGCCFGGVAAPFAPTHTGFGFEVYPGTFVFGSVENGQGTPSVNDGSDNGFWMSTGSLDEMFATMFQPCSSCFHGAIGRPGYTEYKKYTVKSPNSVLRYKLQKNYTGADTKSSGKIVWTLLITSSLRTGKIPAGHTPSDILCPGTWFDALPVDKWGVATPIPFTTSPVKAGSCTNNLVPSSCAIYILPPPNGNCPTTVGPRGPAVCGTLPGVQNQVDCSLQAVVKSALAGAIIPGNKLPCSGVPGGLLCEGTTFPGAQYWCDFCKSNSGRDS